MRREKFSELLNCWEKNARNVRNLQQQQVSLHTEDIIKLAALAEVYQLPVENITAELMRCSLLLLEEEMPYIPGDKIIRMEEGNEVYEDIGPLPKYLAAMHRIQKNSAK